MIMTCLLEEDLDHLQVERENDWECFRENRRNRIKIWFVDIGDKRNSIVCIVWDRVKGHMVKEPKGNNATKWLFEERDEQRVEREKMT